jgi:hypothetical protein
MKFTPNEDFKEGYVTFEAENTYESEKHGISEDQLKAFHAAGWTEVEGWDKAPGRQITPSVDIKVDTATHEVASEVISG